MKYIFVSLLVYALAAVFLKKGAITMDEYTITNILSNYYYYISLGFLFVNALFWQLGLKKIPLSVAYLYKSVHYPLLLLISCFVFNEKITLFNILGTLLILSGIISYKLIDKYE